MRWLAAVPLLFLLIACVKPIELPPSDGQIPVDEWQGTVRPDIPRVNPPIDEPDEEPETPPTTTPPVFINTTRGAPRIELDVPLGDMIGEHHPLITVEEFPLLRHPPVRLGSASLRGYEEELRFDFRANSTGKVIFGKDDDDTIGTFLRFDEGKPILEYRLRLHSGTFADLQGRNIQILGHTYLIAEASNRSVSLYGVDIASNLAFSNDSRLVVNSSSQPDTLVRVKPSEISYILYADDPDEDGILLAPGERLSDRIPHSRLASRVLDIAYVGAPLQDASVLGIERTGYGYRLTAATARGDVTVPLLESDAGIVTLGRADEPLRVTPCPSAQRYCIAPGTNLLLTNPRGDSYLITYADATNDTQEIIIREGSNRYTYRFIGEPGRNAVADLIIDGFPFRAWIGPKDNATGNHNITVDQGFVQGRTELVLRSGARLRIGDVNGTLLPLELRIPAVLTVDRREERISLNITLNDEDGRVLAGGNLTFVEDDDDDLVGLSQSGVGIFLDRDGDRLPPATGREASILVPSSATYGVIALEG